MQQKHIYEMQHDAAQMHAYVLACTHRGSLHCVLCTLCALVQIPFSKIHCCERRCRLKD